MSNNLLSLALRYNPRDWYWAPPNGQNEGFVFSSKAGGLVATNDAAYEAWITSFGQPQTCPKNEAGDQDWASLDWVLINAKLPPTGFVALTQAELQAELSNAVSDAAGGIANQIYTDPAHAAAGQTAGMIVASSGGAPTEANPFFAQFNALAASWGLSPSNFAALVVILAGQSLALSTALNTCQAAIVAATNGAELFAALTAFQTAVTGIVTEINSANPPVPIVAPAAISIKGITS